MAYNIQLANPIKLDATYAADGTFVQYNGDTKEWLAYDSQEMIDYREKCLTEFQELRNKINAHNSR